MHRHRPWLTCRAFGRHHLLGLAALMLLVAGSLLPARAQAHARGLYPTQAEAEKRARELGCQGVHRNNGRWLPCADEAELHKELRQE